MSVPEDVAVIGVDDDDVYCMTSTPQLCSIRTPAQQIGQHAMSQMLDLLNGKAGVPRRVLFQPSDLILRGSSCDTAVEEADVIAALRFIENNIANGVRVGDVADHVLLSRRTLERRFIETLSRTVQAEIRRIKIRHAQRLLIDTTLSYEEVARRSGLLTRSQLNRMIKAALGITPAQYRQKRQLKEGGVSVSI
jgi:LacI family transcriptional regulator